LLLLLLLLLQVSSSLAISEVQEDLCCMQLNKTWLY
jgi:hypothetical protein